MSTRDLIRHGDTTATLTDDLTAVFARELTQTVRLLNAEVRRLVRTLQTRKGRLIAARGNLARTVRLKQDLLTAIRRAGFERLAMVAVDEPLDRLAAAVLKGDRLAGTAAALTPVDIDALSALKELRLAELLGLEAEMATTLWRVTLDGVLGARPLDGLVDDLADALDVSARQARVLYDTAVSTYSRAVGLLGSEGTDDELFLYVGPVDRKTREFCLDYVGRVLRRDEIDDLDNGIKGYGNVLLTGGGPNCRHRWQRVSPLDDEMRALAGTPDRVPYVQTKLDAVREAA